jgi:uncharacterized protein (DUF2147 family)
MKLLMSIAVAAVAVAVNHAHAETPVGLWQSPPDSSGIVLHVRTRPCGQGICGQVERVKNLRGYDAPSRAVGRVVLVDLVPSGDGSFSGQLREPYGDTAVQALMKVQGDVMQIHNCDGNTCRDVVWRRVR